MLCRKQRADAGTAGLVLYVILTTPYQLDLWPYADALGFGVVQMANRDSATFAVAEGFTLIDTDGNDLQAAAMHRGESAVMTR